MNDNNSWLQPDNYTIQVPGKKYNFITSRKNTTGVQMVLTNDKQWRKWNVIDLPQFMTKSFYITSDVFTGVGIFTMPYICTNLTRRMNGWTYYMVPQPGPNFWEKSKQIVTITQHEFFTWINAIDSFLNENMALVGNRNQNCFTYIHCGHINNGALVHAVNFDTSTS